jgi:hypothetical protein
VSKKACTNLQRRTDAQRSAARGRERVLLQTHLLLLLSTTARIHHYSTNQPTTRSYSSVTAIEGLCAVLCTLPVRAVRAAIIRDQAPSFPTSSSSHLEIKANSKCAWFEGGKEVVRGVGWRQQHTDRGDGAFFWCSACVPTRKKNHTF